MQSRRQIIALMVLASLGIVPVAEAASLTLNMPSNTLQSSLPVQWPQESISINQLQGLFSQNPGAQQFMIQFPNGMNWNVTPAGIQSLYNEYSQKAAALGINQLPDLSFSSLGSSLMNSSGATIPIRNTLSSMEQESDNALNDLLSQGSSYFYSLPDWLQTLLQAIMNGLTILYNFAYDQISSLFR